MSPVTTAPLNARSYVAKCSLLFTELPLLERGAAAHAAGFKQVEFWWLFDGAPLPEDHVVEEFITNVHDSGMKLTRLNLRFGDMCAGDKGRLSTPGYSSEFFYGRKLNSP